MTREKIESVIKELVLELSYMGKNPPYDPNKTFEELRMDSLDLVELVMGVEEEFDKFGLLIDDDEAEKLLPPKIATDFICKKLKVDEPLTFVVVNWVDSGHKLCELGFEPVNGAVNGGFKAKAGSAFAGLDIWETAKGIYESGLNVMIKHNPPEQVDALYVDTKRFSQR